MQSFKIFHNGFILLLLTLSVCRWAGAHPLDIPFHGPVKSATVERVALSDKLRLWFAGPHVQAPLITPIEDLRDSVKKSTLPGKLYETEFFAFNQSGNLVNLVKRRGDGYIKSHKHIDYATGGQRPTHIHIDGEMNGAYPDIHYTYDDQGRLSKKKVLQNQNTIQNVYHYQYPEPGVTKIIKHASDGTALDYRVKKYDAQGRLIDESLYSMNDELQVRHSYVFDDSGNMTEERIINKDGQTTGIFQYTYDDEGNKITEDFITLVGGAEMQKEFRYNPQGDPVYYHSWGRKGGRLDREAYEYAYDQYGNWVTKITWQVRMDYYGRPQRAPVQAEYRKFRYWQPPSVE